MGTRRILDLGIGAVAAGWAVFYLAPARPVWWVAVLAALAGLAGGLWRRPALSLAAALLADTAVRFPIGWLEAVPDADEWNVAMCVITAVSLGAFTKPGIAAAGVVMLGLSVNLAEWPDGLSEDLFWPAIPLAGVAILAHVAMRSRRAAASQHSRAAALASTSPEEAARMAVAAERARLLGDVYDVLRTAIESMRANARAAPTCPPAAGAARARAVQHDGRAAITELRRLLGLLRDATPNPSTQPPSEAPPVSAGFRKVDVLVAGCVAAFAGIEFWLWPGDWEPAGPPPTPLALTLSAMAAAAIVLRRVDPGVGAAIAGVLLVVVAVGDLPFYFGLAYVVTAVTLTWSAMGTARIRPVVGVAILFAAVCWYGFTTASTNVDLVRETILATAVVSLVTARHRSAARRSSAAAERLAAERREATERAVRAERLTVARELHDVVSHAVVVMTVQAGAAEALLPTAPAAAGHALDLVVSVATASLDELDRLFHAAGAGSASRDLVALVRRMQTGGLSVEYSIPPDPLPGPVAYRVVQEALTNTLRHAPTATVHLTVSSSAGQTTVEVVDDGPGPSCTGPLRGYGLIGLTERVEHSGGTIRTGPGPGGRGFRVLARIPTETAEAPS